MLTNGNVGPGEAFFHRSHFDGILCEIIWTSKCDLYSEV